MHVLPTWSNADHHPPCMHIYGGLIEGEWATFLHLQDQPMVRIGKPPCEYNTKVENCSFIKKIKVVY